jgi:hypothetical protein
MTATCQPRLPKPTAMARPTPALAPVTTAVWGDLLLDIPLSLSSLGDSPTSNAGVVAGLDTETFMFEDDELQRTQVGRARPATSTLTRKMPPSWGLPGLPCVALVK